MSATARFDLDTLEFGAVRELLVERLQTALGRGDVERLQPSTDAREAGRRLRIVAELAARARLDDRPPVGGAVEVRSWLANFFADRHQVEPRDLADLKRLLAAAARSRGWLASRAECPALAAFAARFPVVDDLVAELADVVDDRGEILDSASVRLAQVRREIVEAEAAVRAAVARFLSDEAIRRCLQSPEPSWRHGRPVFQVRFDQRHRVPGVLHDRSQSGQTVFIEPEVVLQAANRLADARADEHHEIQVVLTQVCRALRRFEVEVLAAADIMGALDLHVAAARLVVEDGYRVAPVTEGGPLRLRGALHPLLLRTAGGRREGLVPLDVTLGEPFALLVVTGPNTGGKTVALKTVGLLAAMAAAGLPVPAEEGSSLPIFDGIFADIGDEQGIAQSLSTFSSHVTRIARCLAAATPRSLVLLDELGAGTDPEEGSALGAAVLEELRGRGTLAVVTTHLGRLKDFAYRHPGVENGAMAFDGASLRPIYRLDVGIPGASHALDVAQRVGMPAPLVARARAILGARDERLESVIERVQEARRDAEQQRRRTERMRREAEVAGEELQRKHREIDAQRNWLAEEADAVVAEFVARLRGSLLEPLRRLASAPKPHGTEASALLEAFDAEVRSTSIHRRRMRFVGELKKNSEVFVPRFGRRCRVRKVDKVRELVSLDLGRMTIDVPFDDVSWIAPLEG
ncbi:MAG: endonuclease MutS2 [Planctomycetes bacterium]|nr:endonuclease MutS2 [Planctomycetota bacterium]